MSNESAIWSFRSRACRALMVMAVAAWALPSGGCDMDPEPDPTLSVHSSAISYNGHDYLFVTSPKDWYSASYYCESIGYELVSVNDSYEESWLHQEQIAKAPYDTKWWIGGNDIPYEGTWAWNDGSPFTFVNWWPGQPDAKYSNEDCIVDGWGQQWNDWACGNQAYFICEQPNVSSRNLNSFTYETGATSNATTNTYQYSIYASAGQVVTAGTCGIFGGSVVYGDTWLRVKNPTGGEIASNDDSCHGTASNISFVAAATGNYTIHGGCYSNNSCKGTVAFIVGP
jgi:hypothetical protein